MARSSSQECRELAVGTWIGVALIAECLIKAGAVDRPAIVGLLSQAEALAKGERRIALSGLRKLIDESLGKLSSDDGDRRAAPRRRSSC